MNTDEAIEVLQESLRQNKVMNESPNVFFSSQDIAGGAAIKAGRRISALEIAIDALRVQQTPAKLDRSRWKRCKMCKDYISLLQGYHYCFICGRPLTEEAWAEMERKMTDG